MFVELRWFHLTDSLLSPPLSNHQLGPLPKANYKFLNCSHRERTIVCSRRKCRCVWCPEWETRSVSPRWWSCPFWLRNKPTRSHPNLVSRPVSIWCFANLRNTFRWTREVWRMILARWTLRCRECWDFGTGVWKKYNWKNSKILKKINKLEAKISHFVNYLAL